MLLTTYNQPDLLERSLLGYMRQDCSDFELLIADDGSGPETAALIARFRARSPVPLHHVWQLDSGFRKARAVNLAALRSRADYLIFSDGDCIPSSWFVSEHLRAARAGQYVVGGHVRLSREQTRALNAQDIEQGRFEKLCSLPQRLELLWTHAKSLGYIAAGKRRKPKFYGLNFSVDRASFERVNGLDMTFENCGREDSDLRNRMQMAGVRARSLWSRPGVFHQHHPAHVTRLGWAEAPHYYNRRYLRADAAQGLRELRAEQSTEEKSQGCGELSPISST